MRLATVALVGSDSLLGNEVRDLLSMKVPDVDVVLVGVKEEGVILTAQAGEPAIIHASDQDILHAAQIVILAGTATSSRNAIESLSRRGDSPALIDLTNTLEDEAGAYLWAPLAELPNHPANAGSLHIIAHPAASILAAFIQKLHKLHPVRRWVVQVFAPASEHGKDGIDELHHQTIQMLSFKSLPKKVFDEQLSFNLLASYGGEAPVSLRSIESRIDRHLAVLLSRCGEPPMPSMRVIQAPVFHGYSFSIWVEFEKNPKRDDLVKALAGSQIEVRTEQEKSPTSVGVAGQSGMTAGNIEIDRNNPRSAWFWMVADNYHTTAENAVRLTQLLIPEAGQA